MNWVQKASELTTKDETEYLCKNEQVGETERNVPSAGTFGSKHDSLAVDADELSEILATD